MQFNSDLRVLQLFSILSISAFLTLVKKKTFPFPILVFLLFCFVFNPLPLYIFSEIGCS